MQMPDEAYTPDELLGDAKVIAAYCQRTGKLRDVVLFSAISNFEKVAKHGWADKQTVTLQRAVIATQLLIAPVTIRELYHWSVKTEDSRSRILKQLFWAISAVLMIVAGYYTIMYNEGLAVANNLDTMITTNTEEQFRSDILRILSKDGSVDDKALEASYKDTSGIYDLIAKARGEALAVTDATLREDEFVQLTIDPVHLIYNRWIAPTITPTVDVNPAFYGDKCLPTSPSGDEANWPDIRRTAQRTEDQRKPASFMLDQLIPAYKAYLYDASCRIQAGIDPFNFPDIKKAAADSHSRIDFLGLWILPAIYGALGASVFYMRRFVDPTIPDPRILRVTYRIALGAFSGIILAWFWTPQVRVSDQAINVGLSLFGVAFLFGFSVEIFFTFLDRMVFLAGNWIKRLGAPAN